VYASSGRTVLALISLASRAVQAPAPATKNISYDEVVERAMALAKQPFDAESAKTSAELSNLTDDCYHEIRFRHDKAFWRDDGSDSRLFPFHLGLLHNQPVPVHVISHDDATRMFLRTRNRTLSEIWTATCSVPTGDAARLQPPKQ
jgi:glucans biosynthesis protein